MLLVSLRVRAETFALDPYEPPPAGDRFFSVESAEAPGHLMVSVAATQSLPMASLVVTELGPDGEEEQTPLVGLLGVVHVGAGFALFNRLKLSVDMPALVAASGESVGGMDPPDAPELGDLRAGGRVVVLGGRERSYRVALGGRVWFPTGEQSAWVGDGKVRGGPELLLSGRAESFFWALASSVTFRRAVTLADTTVDDQLGFGAVAAGVLGRAQISLELAGSVVLASEDAFGGSNTNLELLLGTKYRLLPPCQVGVAVGPGLAEGLGTPVARALLTLSWSEEVRPEPSQPWTPPQTPPSDTPPPPPPTTDVDGDGVVDPLDACPDAPGAASERPSENGCPPRDADRDGIPDDQDTCPFSPGPSSGERRQNGCPRDTDRDAVLDPDDACPTVPGVLNVDRQKNGCPKPQPAP